MYSLPNTPERVFEAVLHDLETVLSDLKDSEDDPNVRLQLLSEMRQLLKEAYRLNSGAGKMSRP